MGVAISKLANGVCRINYMKKIIGIFSDIKKLIFYLAWWYNIKICATKYKKNTTIKCNTIAIEVACIERLKRWKSIKMCSKEVLFFFIPTNKLYSFKAKVCICRCHQSRLRRDGSNRWNTITFYENKYKIFY